jgi:pimeloyl-ACP methyl ester carboxylesterase
MSWAFPYRGETRVLDGAARSQAPGSFVQLSMGITHYELGGPPDGQPVVLVHGFSVPYFIWDPTYLALTRAGFRTVRYDLYGRGYSDRPRLRYGIDLFAQQLAELLNALELERAALVGLSMGGPITATFTARHPGAVSRLALVDPVGFRPMALSPVLQAALLPGLGELAFGLAGDEQLLKGIASDFFAPHDVDMFLSQYREQMRFRGFKRAILSTLRSEALRGSPQAYRRVGELGTPVLLVWGRDDVTIPLQDSAPILQAIPGAEFHVLEHCGHIPQYEQPDLFNPILMEFLERK